MMLTRHRNSGLDEITGAPARRPILLSGAGGALRRRLEELGSAALMQTTPAAGQLTHNILGDAPIAAFAGAFLGCVTTEFFSASGILPCIASALATALLCGLLLLTRTTCLFAGTFFSALYGGTFAGMTPIVWLGDSGTGALSVALSIVCGLVFFVVAELDSRSAAPMGIGCGGRLGAIAIVASFLFVELVRPLGADTSRFHAAATGAFDVESWSAIGGFFASLAGIFGTLLALRQRQIADGGVPVRIFIASAAALSGLIVLHLGNPDDLPAMEAFYAGCFLGMSTRDRLKGWLQPVFGALVLVVVLVPVRAFLNGFGGGLGFAAFIAVLMLVAFSRATAWMTRDMLASKRNFATAMASAMIAVFMVIGLISAEPVAEEVSNSVVTAASGSIADSSDATSVRMVVERPVPGAADQAIPIRISLTNAAADDVVVLSGLPSGSTMTNGRRSATGSWRLSASELADAAIRPEQGFVGGANITVELRRADRSIVDRQELHLEWVGPAPQAKMDVAPPPAAGPPASQIAVAPTEDDVALFREFLQSRGRAAAHRVRPAGQVADAPTEDEAALFREFLQSRGRAVAHRVRPAGRGQHVESQAAASTGPRASVVPLTGAAVRPPHPLGPRGVVADRQKKPAPKNSEQEQRREMQALRGP